MSGPRGSDRISRLASRRAARRGSRRHPRQTSRLASRRAARRGSRRHPGQASRPRDAVVAAAGLHAAAVSAISAAVDTVVHATAAIPDRAIRPAAGRIQPVGLPAAPVSTASTASLASTASPNNTDSSLLVRSVRPVPVRAVPPVHRSRGRGEVEAVAWRHRRHHRPAGGRHRRARAGVGLLEARLRHHQARHQFGSVRCPANPDRRGQRLRCQERQGRQGNDGQSPTVKKGDTFNCEVSIDGTKRQVTVTFQDDSGTYEVGRPNAARSWSSAFCSRPRTSPRPPVPATFRGWWR